MTNGRSKSRSFPRSDGIYNLSSIGNQGQADIAATSIQIIQQSLISARRSRVEAKIGIRRDEMSLTGSYWAAALHIPVMASALPPTS